jgi:hypothetical protein
MKEKIGTNAGRIWEYLFNHGTVGALKLKADLGMPNTSLYLALGWLAREEKIEIVEEAHSVKISLVNQ